MLPIIKAFAKSADIEIVEITPIKIWDKIDKFTLKWSIKIETYVYDQKEVVNKLRNVINDSVLKWIEKIISIDEKSLRIAHILYNKKWNLEIKATVEIEFLTSHDFFNKDDEYTEKLKDIIRWLKKEEAIKILLNDNKISDVKIDIRPFFIDKISNITDNIIFEIIDN